MVVEPAFQVASHHFTLLLRYIILHVKPVDMDDPLENLMRNYHELNAAVVDELHEEPSALEFMRYVSKNIPFVVRQAAVEWKAFEKWDASYLRQQLGDEEVKVAVTPSG